ncbi:AAA family ATPase [Actinomyces vulturis]|uniref:AAA family ATPase n=1 Tax=Actinomyces vulturis TaxID=1857645 RepID=UPI0008378756|nr:AAA family ATPase [Actinomyces vulturis]
MSEPKMPGVIESITIAQATFQTETITPTALNFFFGKNGAGKSTIGRVIRSGNTLRWGSGIDPAAYSVLVFNQEFITDNFSTCEGVNGVFTLGKENIEAQENIKRLEEGLKQAEETVTQHQQVAEGKETQLSALAEGFREICWSCTAQVRTQLPLAVKGKKTKALFASHVLEQSEAIEHDYSELSKLYAAAFNDQAKTYTALIPISHTLPSSDLVSEPIVSSAQTPFAQFVQNLNATDWVRQGHIAFTHHDGDPCPYCQQTLPADFEDLLASCFDDAYETNLATLKTFIEDYTSVARQIWSAAVPPSSLPDVHPDVDLKEYGTAAELLRSQIEGNIQLLNKKLQTPSTQVELVDLAPTIRKINDLIRQANVITDAHNAIVADQAHQRKACTRMVWEHLAHILSEEVETYRKQKQALTTEKEEAHRLAAQARKTRDNIERTLREARKTVVNTQSVITEINRLLKDSGFQGFHLASNPGHEDTYRVVRADGTTAVHLSEGERNFIAFLYFYYLVHGSHSLDEGHKHKIVVIDDPVSSMDSATMHVVAFLVRELASICENTCEYRHHIHLGDFIKQLFVLTHNAYFFREVSYNHLSDYRYASYYLIRKDNNVSTIKQCTRNQAAAPSQLENYSPVVHGYAALWQEYQEATSAVVLMNVMRRILEHYFLQLCGYEGSNIANRILKENRERFIKYHADGHEDQSEYNLVAAVLAYITHGISGIDEDAYYIADAQDPDQLRAVFERIFTLMDQHQHYDMMTNTHLPSHRADRLEKDSRE